MMRASSVILSDAPPGGGAESKDLVAGGNEDRDTPFPAHCHAPGQHRPHSEFRTPDSHSSPSAAHLHETLRLTALAQGDSSGDTLTVGAQKGARGAPGRPVTAAP